MASIRGRTLKWAILAILASAVSCSSSPASFTPATRVNPTAVRKRFEGQRAFAHVASQMALGPRVTGTLAIRQLGDQILSLLQATGWATKTQEFAYRDTPVRNVWGTKGSGPIVRIVGAHYDTRRRADQDAEDTTAGVPGANDGASGVAVLLELARVLEPRVGEQVWLVFFDAEDNGELDNWDWIVGSRAFVSAMEIVPASVVVIDMVGDKNQEIFFDRNSDVALSQRLWSIASSLGYEEQFRAQPKYAMEDDHTPFRERGWSAIDIIDFDYPSWHTRQDTLDKISAASLEHVGRVLQTWLEMTVN